MELLSFDSLPPKTLTSLNIKLRPISSQEISELSVIFQKLSSTKETPNLKYLQFLSQPLNEAQLTELNTLLTNSYTRSYQQYDSELAQIPLSENQDKMVSLEKLKLSNVKFSTEPFSNFCGEYAGQKRFFYLRHHACQQFITMADKLAHLDIGILVLDAFRPLKIQKSLYQNTIERLSAANPAFSHDKITTIANAKTAFAPWIAAHTSGAALDIFLFDLTSKKHLDIGNQYRETHVHANLNFPFLTFQQYKSRFIFYHAALASEFTPYPAENWHISYGDVGDAHRKQTSAQYSSLHDFDLETGTINPMKSVDLLKNF